MFVNRYISPEFMNLCVKELKYHIKKADIFSLGCTVYELSTKKPLTSEMNEEIRASRIKFPQNFESKFGTPFLQLLMVYFIFSKKKILISNTF